MSCTGHAAHTENRVDDEADTESVENGRHCYADAAIAFCDVKVPSADPAPSIVGGRDPDSDARAAEGALNLGSVLLDSQQAFQLRWLFVLLTERRKSYD